MYLYNYYRRQTTPEVKEKEEDDDDEQLASSDEECTFQEKKFPSSCLNSEGGGESVSEGEGVVVKEEGEVVSGNFKGFAFKKSTSGTSRNIKSRTSHW